ncbi:MAG: AAA family ATPase [Burkholderiaceae bacterium]
MDRMNLFGGFELVADDARCNATPGRRGQLLLAHLVLARGAPVGRAVLGRTLWPDSDPPQALTNVRRELHLLRRAWPVFEQAIGTARDSLRWNPTCGVRVDVLEFLEHLEAAEVVPAGLSRAESVARQAGHLRDAVSLARGGLLPAIDDHWIDDERQILQRRLVGALRVLVQHETGLRRFDEALLHATRWQQIEPFDESACAARIALCLRCGERVAALGAYEAFAALLDRELGTTPGPVLRAMMENLAANSGPTSPFRGDPLAGRAAPAVTASALVGRSEQLERLEAEWSTCVPGTLKMIVIGGEPGIGKSRLAAEFLARREAAAEAVVRARSAADGHGFDAVRNWFSASTLRPGVETLDAEAAAALSSLLDAPATHARSARDASAPQRPGRQLFNTLVQVLDAVASPLVLYLDDLQWCDGDSARWLAHLVRGGTRARVLLLCTMRPRDGRSGTPVDALLDDARRTKRLVELALGPLSEQAAHLLALQSLDERQSLEPRTLEMLRACCHRAGGNPLFVTELVRAWEMRETGSARSCFDDLVEAQIERVICGRVERLSPLAQQVLGFAALAGARFDEALVGGASGIDSASVVAALDECWRNALLREFDDGMFGFNHDCVREAIEAALGPGKRRDLHRRLATALESGVCGEPMHHSAALARHHARAGNVDDAARWFERAGEIAGRMFSVEASCQHFRDAISLLERKASPENAADRLRLLIHLAHMTVVSHGMSSLEAEDVAKRIEGLLPLVVDPMLRMQAFERLRVFHGARGNIDSAISWSRALDGAMFALREHGSTVYAKTLLASVLELAGRIDEANAMIDVGLGELDQPGQQIRPGRQLGAHLQNYLLLTIGALLRLRRGDPAATALLEARANALVRSDLWPYLRGIIDFQWSRLAFLRRDPAMARHYGERLVDEGGRFGALLHSISGRFTCGWALACEGNRAGIEAMQGAIREFDAPRLGMHAPMRYALLAEQQLAHDMPDEALACIASTIDLSRATGSLDMIPDLLRLEGIARALRSGRADDAAIECFRGAASMVADQGDRLTQMRALLELAKSGATAADRRAIAGLRPILEAFSAQATGPNQDDAQRLLALDRT